MSTIFPSPLPIPGCGRPAVGATNSAYASLDIGSSRARPRRHRSGDSRLPRPGSSPTRRRIHRRAAHRRHRRATGERGNDPRARWKGRGRRPGGVGIRAGRRGTGRSEGQDRHPRPDQHARTRHRHQGPGKRAAVPHRRQHPAPARPLRPLRRHDGLQPRWRQRIRLQDSRPTGRPQPDTSPAHPGRPAGQGRQPCGRPPDDGRHRRHEVHPPQDPRGR